MRAPILLLVPLFSIASAFPQDDVYIFGTIKDYRGGGALTDAMVIVASELGVRDSLYTDEQGRYEINLPYDRLWQMRYEAPGKVTKLVAVDTRDVPMEEREGGHGMNIDIKLFEAQPGKDYSVMKQPMSIARYVDSTGEIAWDMEMVERMRLRMAPLLPDTTAPAMVAKPPRVVGLARFGTTEIILMAAIVLVLFVLPIGVTIWWFMRKRARRS